MHHEGNLVVDDSNREYALTLTSIGGAFHSRAEGVAFPALTSIGGCEIRPAEERRSNLVAVAEAALADGALDMGAWHTCATTHCIAGWAVHLSPLGREIEAEWNTSTAAAILLGPEHAWRFYSSDEYARAWLLSTLEAEAA
jgi:hypothetical protein